MVSYGMAAGISGIRMAAGIFRIHTPRGKMELGASIIVAVIVCVVAAAIFAASYEKVGMAVGEKQSSTACGLDGIIEMAASGNLISPIIATLNVPIREVASVVSDALDKLQGLLGKAKWVMVGIGLVAFALSILAAPFTAGSSLVAGFKVAMVITSILGFAGAGGMGIAEEEIGEVIAHVEDVFAEFAGEDFLNAERVGGCASGLVLREKPPDLSQRLAEEVDACLKLGEDAGGFRLCREAIVIAKPDDDCKVYSTQGRFMKQTDECSVTFFLAVFYGWGHGRRSNARCEDGSECCKHPDALYSLWKVEKGEMVGKDLTQGSDLNLLDWDTTLCRDGQGEGGGVIEEGEQCIVEMYYGFDHRVHVRAVS